MRTICRPKIFAKLDFFATMFQIGVEHFWDFRNFD